MKLKNCIVLISLFILGCSGSDDKDVEWFTLKVNKGLGGGLYEVGKPVSIAADTAQDGFEFDQWSGDTQSIANTMLPITSIIMPAKDIEVTATYKLRDLGDPVAISVDKNTKYQTIDGFGFFGAQDVWWGNSTGMWNEQWGEKVIRDLGITIWRNEYFPPSTSSVSQDADWTKQKPVIQGLKAKADQFGVNLKFIFTVWSPPANLKWQSKFTWPGDENATRQEGMVSTKNGGTLNPNKYNEFADWLKNGIQLYKDLGIDLYALSLQNELMFTQSFNSCTYTFSWYNDLLKNVVPKLKSTFPNVKIFGSENMLDLEGANINWPYFYHAHLKADTEAAKKVDILAVHGYSDGIAPTSGSALAERWTNHKNQFSSPMLKQSWMTETSGYEESWLGSTASPGALSLAQDIHAGLYYGNINAWVWWQGSQSDEIGKYNLMNGTTAGKKYYVSKHYYRYIRPGAVRLAATSSDPEIFITAYEHTAKRTHTLVAINSGGTDRFIYLQGTGLPDTFSMYRTNSGGENCKLIGTQTTGLDNKFVIPAKTIITLQAGGDAL